MNDEAKGKQDANALLLFAGVVVGVFREPAPPIPAKRYSRARANVPTSQKLMKRLRTPLNILLFTSLHLTDQIAPV